MIISCTTTGVPRITVRYTLQIAFRIFNLPVLSCVVRTIAIKNPSTTPINTANTVTNKVIFRPSVIYLQRLSSIKFEIKLLFNSCMFSSYSSGLFLNDDHLFSCVIGIRKIYLFLSFLCNSHTSRTKICFSAVNCCND